ncbi:MAG: TonB-dependent receptor [Sulfurimonas sp.]|nr:TonB-dependent receptor [Sulfurimonas sp.]
MKTKVYISVVCAFALNVAASDLGTIQVESSTIDDKFANKTTEISSTASMSGAEVEVFHAENIADVLNTLPGVTVRKNEGDSNKIHIRGIATEMYMGEKPGVAIVIDGVPVQERAGSINIDADNIESIKVLKGGASYLYGNDALAGAIIITTKRPKNRNKGFATVERGSNGYAKYLATYNVGTENFAANIQASYKKSDGYWEDSDYYTKSLNGKFQYYIDDSSDLTLGVDKTLRYENDTGSITYATYDPNTGLYTNNVVTNPTSKGEIGFATKYEIELTKLFLTYSKDFDNDSNLMAQIYQYEDSTQNRSSAYDSTGDGVRDDNLNLTDKNTIQRGFKSEYRLSGRSIASMLGVDIARNEETANNKYRVDYTGRDGVDHTIGEVSSNTESKEAISAIYGELKYALSKDFTTTLNARYDNIKYDYKNNLTATDKDTEYNEASYRAGATYNVAPKKVLFTNFSTGFRVPTVTQMYAGDIIGASWSGTYVNNLSIKVEKTYNYEIGFRSSNDMLSYEVSLYQLDRKDVIGNSIGNYASSDGTEDLFYDNMADIRNRGLELGINSNRNKTVSFVLNYTYLDSTYVKYDKRNLLLEGETVATAYNLTGNTVPRTSKHTVYVEGNYRVSPGLLLTANVNYRSSQFADDMNEVEVENYTLLNLRAKYNTKISNMDLEFFANIDNFFDKQYFMMPRVTGDRNDDGLYDVRDMGLTVNPGRTFLAGLSARF